MTDNNVNDMWAGFAKWSEDSLRGIARAIGWAPPAPGPAPTPSPSATRASPLKMTLRSDSRTAFITGSVSPTSSLLSDNYGEFAPGDTELGPPDPRHVAPPPVPPPPPTTDQIAVRALEVAYRSMGAQEAVDRDAAIRDLRHRASARAQEALRIAGTDPAKARALAEGARRDEAEAAALEGSMSYGELF